MCHKWQSYDDDAEIFPILISISPRPVHFSTYSLKVLLIDANSFEFFCYLRCQSNVWFLRYWVQPTYFLVILDHFFLFYPLTTPKIKILKKWKECLEILSFYTWVPWITIIWCTVPEIWSMTDRIFCHLGQFFCPFTPLKTWKINILNKWRKNLEILSFYTSIPKIMIIYAVLFLRYGVWQM